MSEGDEVKIDIRVETAPVAIHFECPHCNRDIFWKYNYFVGEIGEVCDWEYSIFGCPKCDKELEIDTVDWD